MKVDAGGKEKGDRGSRTLIEYIAEEGGRPACICTQPNFVDSKIKFAKTAKLKLFLTLCLTVYWSIDVV